MAVTCLSDYLYASHYYWRDSKNLLIHARNKEAEQLYLLKDLTQEYEVIDAEYFLKDGHCSYSPCGEWILYNSYPDIESYRHLYLYNVKQKKGGTLASLYSYLVTIINMRCDLHVGIQQVQVFPLIRTMRTIGIFIIWIYRRL